MKSLAAPLGTQRAFAVFVSQSGDRTERRSHRRVRLQAPVLVDARSAWTKGRCLDVSVGGVVVTLEIPLAVDSIVELYFELPSGVAVEAEARVVRCEAGQAALSFVALSPPLVTALQHYVQTRERSLRLLDSVAIGLSHSGS